MPGHRFVAAIVLPALGVHVARGCCPDAVGATQRKGPNRYPRFRRLDTGIRTGPTVFPSATSNRNLDEALEIPIGPNNYMESGPANQGQPSHFQPRRHWGVFAVNVPANFGYERIVWTLKIRGETFVIPGNLNKDWEIDALRGEAARATHHPASVSIRGERKATARRALPENHSRPLSGVRWR